VVVTTDDARQKSIHTRALGNAAHLDHWPALDVATRADRVAYGQPNHAIGQALDDAELGNERGAGN